jgi:hypothetical protein
MRVISWALTESVGVLAAGFLVMLAYAARFVSPLAAALGPPASCWGPYSAWACGCSPITLTPSARCWDIFLPRRQSLRRSPIIATGAQMA